MLFSASLLQSLDYATKMFPGMPPLPIPVVILVVLAVGGVVGYVNGFFVAKFQLHPFIVTLATQLIVYGLLLMYIMIKTAVTDSLCSGLRRFLQDLRYRQHLKDWRRCDSELRMVRHDCSGHHVVHLE